MDSAARVGNRFDMQSPDCFMIGNFVCLLGKLGKVVSSAFMHKLEDNCSNMTSVELKFLDLKLITVNDLPKKIEKLKLKRCEIPVDWFSKNNFKNLYFIDLTDSARTCTQHIRDLTQNCKTNLKSLILTNCYRIVDASVDLITKEFSNLICLKLNGTKCTSLSVHYICTRMTAVEIVDVRNCIDIIKDDIDSIRMRFASENTNFQLFS
jgi:hypothetical protein